jgi:hypothetical protein
MSDALRVGAAEVDITPPIGTPMCGGIKPRASEGIEDPLTAKALVLEAGGQRLAYVLLDLCALERSTGDAAVALASKRTGIPPQNILWAASHTHTGPYVIPFFGEGPSVVNADWLATLPGKFADAVEAASKRLRPAALSRTRGYCNNLGHNRRLRYKDGREINTWLLHCGEHDVQCLGAAGPVDPEVGILCFDGDDGRPIAVLWHFTLHTNTNFGKRFSADYPAVVAARLRERFGPDVISLYMPGACADINTIVRGHRAVGDILSDVILARLTARKPLPGPVALAAIKEDFTAEWRDLEPDQDPRIRSSQWPAAAGDAFRKEVEIMRCMDRRSDRTVLQAWRIGDTGFASLPGELFVEYGLRIKEKSPFPWTYPLELGGDYIGYMVTPQAWKAGGYESLICRSARPSVDAVEAMVDRTIAMLGKLWRP